MGDRTSSIPKTLSEVIALSRFAQSGGMSGGHTLQMDLSRIPIRNLGRDDRVISSRGKEAGILSYP